MSEQNNDESARFERELAQLAPRASRIDRETLLFRAGQESVLATRSRTPWLWPLATAAMALVSAGLSWQLFSGSEPGLLERPRIVERSDTTRPPGTPFGNQLVEKSRDEIPRPSSLHARQDIPRDHYLRRRELALTLGMDALSVPIGFRTSDMAEPPSYRELRSSYTAPSTMERDRESGREPKSNHPDPGGTS